MSVEEEEERIFLCNEYILLSYAKSSLHPLSNNTGSDNGKQPAAPFQRQRALAATGFVVYIQHLPQTCTVLYMDGIVRFKALLL